MLLTLAIRDVVLIERLDLSFAAGLSVLTGETGAGKSILLDALGLALGARADASLIRSGASQASVTAEFEPTPGALALLAENDIAVEGAVITRRVINADGRSRALVNDQAVGVTLLRSLGQTLVEIHGQADQFGLLDAGTHRATLDAFARPTGAARETGAAYAAWRAADSALRRAEEELAEGRRQEEYLRHASAELDELAPAAGEETSLAERRALLQTRVKLAASLGDAMSELVGERGADGAIGRAMRTLGRLRSATLDPMLAALDRAQSELGEAVEGLSRLAEPDDGELGSIEAVEERLFALRALARKHRVTVDDLPALRERFSGELSAIETGGGRLAELELATKAARAAYLTAAEALSAQRTAAAAKLDRAVGAELGPLKLDRARFRTVVERLPEREWSAAGQDRVAFEIATNPGQPFGPIGKIASGGELARFMLSLKVVLAASGSLPTLVFDEVDSGIGGATADAVGDRLARLGQSLQVLAVTHSPQVAARAKHHWRVAKQSSKTSVSATVEALDDASRREEIARMLSGATITEAARAAASSLIAASQ